MENQIFVIRIDEKPKPLKWFMLSFQHVFAMFGPTILVPILTGRLIGVALFTSGIGTLAYIFLTKKKIPMYLGSSFSFIGAVTAANAVSQAGLIIGENASNGKIQWLHSFHSLQSSSSQYGEKGSRN